MKESENWKEETTQHWFSYFQIARKYSKSFMTILFKNCFDDFGIWL